MKEKIWNSIAANPFMAAQDIVEHLDLPCTHHTVRNYLNAAGFVRRKLKPTLDLTPTHLETRDSWAKKLRCCHFFGDMVFSDECSIWLNDNGHEGWFHKNADHPLSYDKHAGKIHVFGAISCLGKINLYTFRGNLNSTSFADILRQQLIPQANMVHLFGWILVEDNSPFSYRSPKKRSSPCVAMANKKSRSQSNRESVVSNQKNGAESFS